MFIVVSLRCINSIVAFVIHFFYVLIAYTCMKREKGMYLAAIKSDSK